MDIASFVRDPLPLSLSSVPGVDEKNNAILLGSRIANTHQLIGQFLLFHARDVDAQQLHNRFVVWLRKLGVTTNETMIASAVAQKVGTWVDGVFDTDMDSWDLCSDVGSTSPSELKDRYCALQKAEK